jgi:hypothetical protein
MSMNYYMENASECLRLADTSPECPTRAVLVDMARIWMKLSDHARACNLPYISNPHNNEDLNTDISPYLGEQLGGG